MTDTKLAGGLLGVGRGVPGEALYDAASGRSCDLSSSESQSRQCDLVDVALVYNE